MATNCLAHQRLSDRAMLEQALERLDVISYLNKDVTAQHRAALIRRLMDIEADTGQGDQCQNKGRSVSSSDPKRGDVRNGDISAAREPGSDHDLLSIPYLKAIWNARGGPIAREPSLDVDTVSPPSLSLTMDAHAHCGSEYGDAVQRYADIRWVNPTSIQGTLYAELLPSQCGHHDAPATCGAPRCRRRRQ